LIEKKARELYKKSIKWDDLHEDDKVYYKMKALETIVLEQEIRIEELKNKIIFLESIILI